MTEADGSLLGWLTAVMGAFILLVMALLPDLLGALFTVG